VISINHQRVTVAGETIAAAMLSDFLAAVVIGYATLRVIGEWTIRI
jgi:hypothetical protein